MNIETKARYKATQKAINELIENMKKSIPVLESFDNKIVNVKLINEIKLSEIESYVSLQTNGDKKSLVYKANNRNESYSNGQKKHSNWAYAEIDSTTIFLQFKNCGKRLDFSATKDVVDKQVIYLSELLEKYSINEDIFSKLEKKFDLLHSELEKIINSISYQEKSALFEKGKYRYFKM